MAHGAVGALFIGSCFAAHFALESRSLAAVASESVEVGGVDIEVPEPAGEPKKKAPEEGCHGCSLAKHEIEELTVAKFRDALASYARAPHWQPSEALDTLLFYQDHTARMLEEHGTGPLPAEHVAFLRRELGRDHVLVALRLVDERGEVRAQYGPERVPIGQKEHLHTEGAELYDMEFNGTVMRTGLYHLWSRY